MPFKYRLAATIFALQTILIVVIVWQGERLFSLSDPHHDALQRSQTLALVHDLGRKALMGEPKIDPQSLLKSTFDFGHFKKIIITDPSGRGVAAIPENLVGALIAQDADGSDRPEFRQEIVRDGAPIGTFYYDIA